MGCTDKRLQGRAVRRTRLKREAEREAGSMKLDRICGGKRRIAIVRHRCYVSSSPGGNRTGLERAASSQSEVAAKGAGRRVVGFLDLSSLLAPASSDEAAAPNAVQLFPVWLLRNASSSPFKGLASNRLLPPCFVG
jgi:hypothetical protein